jgi:hypothetical protein
VAQLNSEPEANPSLVKRNRSYRSGKNKLKNEGTKEQRNDGKNQLFAPFLDPLYRLANETHFSLLQIRPPVKKVVNCSVQAKEHRVDCEITPKGVEREHFCFWSPITDVQSATRFHFI